MGKLFVVTGPSGAGKDSVIEEARRLGLQFGTVTTTSSRPMRDTEQEGHPYYFVAREQFEQYIADGKMMEWAEVYGNLYGSTREEVERVLIQHTCVIMKVDPQGARQLKKMIPTCTTIFIQPPSLDYLRRRLVHRGSDSQDVIAKRLAVAQQELENMKQWDVVIRNDEGKLIDAAKTLMSFIQEKL